MRVRIRFRRGPKVSRKRRTNRKLALAVAPIFAPLAFTAAVLAFWRIAADLNWSGSFAISQGLFSHWHTWMAVAVLFGLCGRSLNRYGKSGDTV